MPFETSAPGVLEGKITSVTIHEAGPEPTTIIRAGEDWSATIEWEMNGPNPIWQSVTGTWHVHVNLETMGPGRDLSLNEYTDPDCDHQYFPSVDGKYQCTLNVPGSVISRAIVPHQSLIMKLVAVITCKLPAPRENERGPIAGYFEGPILQFYETP